MTGEETDPGGGHELLKTSHLETLCVHECLCVCACISTSAHMHMHMHLCTWLCAGDGSGGSLTSRPCE